MVFSCSLCFPLQLCRWIGKHNWALAALLLGMAAGFLTAKCYMSSVMAPKILQPKHVIVATRSQMVTNFSHSLFDEVRILCWVLTNPTNHWSKTQFVKRTWAKRCNIVLFMSSAEEPVLGTIALPVEEGRNHLWYKVRAAFRYVHEHYLNDADFFIKADDDTYLILENLRMLLHGHSASDPIWFGSHFRLPDNHDQGYMSGGSGYCLSREAVVRLVEIAFPNRALCLAEDHGNEDVEMGLCMEHVNVTAVDGRDSHYKDVFNPFPPAMHLIPSTSPDFWFYKYRFYGHNDKHDMGDNCSSAAVAFHYVPPHEMVLFDYMIYNISAYGIEDAYLKLPPQPLDKRHRVATQS